MKKIEKLKNIGKPCPGVYALVNHSNQKCYIGQTKNLKDRIACDNALKKFKVANSRNKLPEIIKVNSVELLLKDVIY